MKESSAKPWLPTSKDTGEADRLKNRSNLNLLIDALLFVVLAALAGIGWLMKCILLPGRDRILKYGENRDLLFLGWDRHQWGTVHLVVALVMLGLLALHIVFHWKTILCMGRNAVPSRPLRLTLTVILLIASVALFLAAFVVRPEKSETDDFLYRNVRGNRGEPGPGRTSPPEISAPAAGGQGGEATGVTGKDTVGGESGNAPSAEPRNARVEEEDHQPGTGEALLNGRMTLAEAADACGISPAEAKRRLGLPEDYPGSETLGRLCRARGLTMIQIRGLLEKIP